MFGAPHGTHRVWRRKNTPRLVPRETHRVWRPHGTHRVWPRGTHCGIAVRWGAGARPPPRDLQAPVGSVTYSDGSYKMPNGMLQRADGSVDLPDEQARMHDPGDSLRSILVLRKPHLCTLDQNVQIGIGVQTWNQSRAISNGRCKKGVSKSHNVFCAHPSDQALSCPRLSTGPNPRMTILLQT